MYVTPIVAVGYLAINGSRWLDIPLSPPNAISTGMNIVELNVTTCKALKTSYYQTNSMTSESNSMATYINGLPTYTVLIGVSASDCFLSLNDNGISALLNVGVNITGLGLRRFGKLTFVAQVGQPAMTLAQVGQPGGNGTKLTVSAMGRHFKMIVTTLSWLEKQAIHHRMSVSGARKNNLSSNSGSM